MREADHVPCPVRLALKPSEAAQALDCSRGSSRSTLHPESLPSLDWNTGERARLNVDLLVHRRVLGDVERAGGAESSYSGVQ
jgi:hypothetical protein